MHETKENHVLLLSKMNIPGDIQVSVPRPRLIERLNEALDCRATYIAAPAGYGKTNLIREWANQVTRPLAWLSLDEKDNDLIRFWHYVTAAIERSTGRFSEAFQTSFAALRPGHYEPMIIALLNEFNRLSQPLALILDDWHEIHDPDILSSVGFMLEYLPQGIHLTFASRYDNDFIKSRWISRGWVYRIYDVQMRFDIVETGEFFRLSAHKELDHDQLEQVLTQTEGWVTGLKLIALSWRHEKGLGTLRLPSLERSGVEEYLFQEVFNSLDESIRSFLLDVSVLQRLHRSLCQAVAGDGGAEMLEEVARLNLFLLPLDDGRQWYQFHRLFGDFLRREEERRRPGNAAKLLRTAAEWCESRELFEEAVDYYLAGANYGEAIRLLEQMGSVLIRREFSTMKTWLSAIPEDLLLLHPYLYFSYTHSLLWSQDVTLAELYLHRAEQYYEETGDRWEPEERDRYLGYLYYVRNFKATQYEMDMVKALKYIQLSLQYSPQGTDLIFASPLMPLSPSVFRSYNGKRGLHLPRGLADGFFTSMIEFMGRMGLQDSVVVCYGELMYERNELEQAEVYLKQGLKGQSQAHYQPEKVYVPASLFLSRIYQARRDEEQAEGWIADAFRRAVDDGVDEALILLDTERAAMRLRHGDLGLAMEWQERYGLSAEDLVSVHQLFPYTFLVRLLIETGRLDEAWRLSDKLLPIAVKGHRPMDALDLETLQAMILQLAGKPQEALLKLEAALKLAKPDDYVRVFTDKGQRLSELLAIYVEQRQKGNLRDDNATPLEYVRKVLSSFERPAKGSRSSSKALETLLTPRELTIFRCMEEGMDNPSIVEALGIGMGTLKAHINRIYGKLQVKNRVEAMIRGKEIEG
ncbi:LuxR C-terminal-related transcriptional regulator [Paenibacillus sp. MBLB2552]|uniref:LuxR C-terminal-related transcriptional regulator n=1 Tax=Paenibacillus mellifer TaxID=2937794 RepID=A0A9X2BRZ0_9BACL|nr:LuxR C-terminal-related transcriptional regulator [Paenibacillus mellifer]MCK8489347.1 LuxR C-terminal-related transcriptional regulator [Paenibacillus mellifer]